MSDSVHTFSSAAADVLRAPTHLGLVAMPDFVHRVRAAFETAPEGRLLVDLSPVTLLDRRVLRSLAWARRHAVARGGHLEMVLPGPGVLGDVESQVLQPRRPGASGPAIPAPRRATRFS